MAENRARKKARLNFTEEIVVLVGPEQRRFTIHKNEICQRSEYFKAACSESWNKHEASRIYKLPEDDPDIFDIYLYCIYKDEVDVGDFDQALKKEETMQNCAREECRLIHAYILADRLLDPISANMIIDELVEIYVNNEASPDDIASEHVANKTLPKSPLRRLFIDMFSREASSNLIEHLCNLDGIPRSFIAEVLQDMAKIHEVEAHKKISTVFYTEFLRNQRKCSATNEKT